MFPGTPDPIAGLSARARVAEVRGEERRDGHLPNLFNRVTFSILTARGVETCQAPSQGVDPRLGLAKSGHFCETIALVARRNYQVIRWWTYAVTLFA
jgi:hypothetical protein